jgi:hypothetical protein
MTGIIADTLITAAFACVTSIMGAPETPMPQIQYNTAIVAQCGAGVIGGRAYACYVNPFQPGTRGQVFFRQDVDYTAPHNRRYVAWEMVRAVQHARGDWSHVSKPDMRDEAFNVSAACDKVLHNYGYSQP